MAFSIFFFFFLMGMTSTKLVKGRNGFTAIRTFIYAHTPGSSKFLRWVSTFDTIFCKSFTISVRLSQHFWALQVMTLPQC